MSGYWTNPFLETNFDWQGFDNMTDTFNAQLPLDTNHHDLDNTHFYAAAVQQPHPQLHIRTDSSVDPHFQQENWSSVPHTTDTPESAVTTSSECDTQSHRLSASSTSSIVPRKRSSHDAQLLLPKDKALIPGTRQNILPAQQPTTASRPSTPGSTLDGAGDGQHHGLSASASMSPSDDAPAVPFGARKEWAIPPRPKPGRKPATDKPSEKRKAQNREAQRAFRERKVAHTTELKQDVASLNSVAEDLKAHLAVKTHKLNELTSQKETADKRIEELTNDLHARDNAIDALENERANLEKQVHDLHKLLERREDIIKTQASVLSNMKRSVPGLSIPTQALNYQFGNVNNELMPDAIAMMNNAVLAGQRRSPITPPHHPHSPLDGPVGGMGMPQHQGPMGCGNCDADGRCPCVDQFVDPVPHDPMASALEVDVAATLTGLRASNGGYSPPRNGASHSNVQSKNMFSTADQSMMSVDAEM
ncbi:hypothetical protein NA57DRAFT_59341 [Rhizodiscina lignyota]|uniref:BZIP domain-containing protein n=1 Tax=Rhizodiscina lignyota TaxID=1504668 RepID=A0A9P4I949_9PEZI|nr:hypothetical protein NA57DRAFT_59341 [Rhizodiscina lignyota]